MQLLRQHTDSSVWNYGISWRDFKLGLQHFFGRWGGLWGGGVQLLERNYYGSSTSWRDKVALWHQIRSRESARPPAKNGELSSGGPARSHSHFHSRVTTMTCVAGEFQRFHPCENFKNSFRAQRRFFFLTSFVDSVKGFRACRGVTVWPLLKATFIEPFSAHTSLNNVWAKCQTCTALLPSMS